MMNYIIIPLLLAEANAYLGLQVNRRSFPVSLSRHSEGSMSNCLTNSNGERAVVTAKIGDIGVHIGHARSSSSRQLNKRRESTALFCSSPSDATTDTKTEETPIALIDQVLTNTDILVNANQHTQQQGIIDQSVGVIATDNVTSDVLDKAAIATVTVTEAKPLPYVVINKTQLPVKVAKPSENALKKFLKGNWLVIGEVMVIMMAKINPSFGATGGRLRPEFFISKLGVFTIFFINGIALSIGRCNILKLFHIDPNLDIILCHMMPYDVMF